MRWKAIIGLALVPAIVAGCAKQCYLTENDYHAYHDIELPADIQVAAGPGVVAQVGDTPAPATVLNTRRQNRYLSLREALAIALENGTVGSQSPAFPRGHAIENVLRFDGLNVIGSDAIRVLALEPAIGATDIEASLSRFDVSWTTSLNWTRSDEPVGAPLPLIQPGIAPLTSLQGINPPGTFVLPNTAAAEAIHADTVRVDSGLVKPLPTGGVAGITFTTDYEHTIPSLGSVNPAYRPSLQFTFEQPLLQGFGVEINELLAQHPSSLLTPFPRISRVEGILITRLRRDEARAEFERTVNFLLLNVEIAYWNLYGSYYQLYSREEAMRVGFEVWRLNESRFKLGAVDERDVSLSRLEYERFRSERLTALGQVLENERQLRGLLNLPTEDGTRIIPSDAPTVAPFQPDWATSLNEALTLRPELLLARQDLKFRQLDLIRQKNLLLPDLRFLASYNLHSLGGQLDAGDTPSNAFHELVTDPFGTASLGLVMNVPLGHRDAHAAVRAAELNLARSYEVLRTEENKAERYLALQYRQVLEFNEQIAVQQAAREAATRQLELRFKQYQLGREQLDLLMDAQREWADAVAGEYNAIVLYNNALIEFQFGTGTIMRYDKVLIAEGPLPHCVEVRAVEHEREMTQARVLREQASPAAVTACWVKPGTGSVELPKLPAGTALSLPALLPNTLAGTQLATDVSPPAQPAGQSRPPAAVSRPSAKSLP